LFKLIIPLLVKKKEKEEDKIGFYKNTLSFALSLSLD
jgi:hypothetical protein